MDPSSKYKILPPLPDQAKKYPQRIHTSANEQSNERIDTERHSVRPPPLKLKSSTGGGNGFMDLNQQLSSSSASFSSSASDSPSSPLFEDSRLHSGLSQDSKNVVITHQSNEHMVSARSLSKKPLGSRLEARSLNRRNIKKLRLKKLEPLASEHSSAVASPCDSATGSAYYHDPERKHSTDELISDIQRLELGVEYQVPIKADELVQLKKLGSGNSGTVSKVLHLPTQKIMARKTIHLDAKEMVQSQILRELRIMHECDSPFIIDFYGAFISEGDVVICMEYVDCGSFDKILKITGPLPEFMLKHVAYSVLSGLNYLYDTHRIIHRDVKPSNVLLDSKGNIKLCDFGVSKELINSMADTFVGTSTYMSPERIQGGVYTVKGDVWSLGIMLYELASGRHAFSVGHGETQGKPSESILELLQRIVNEKPPTLSPEDGYSPELCDFIAQSLKRENERPGPRELMKHRFLSDFIDADGFRVSQKYRSSIKRWAKNVRRVQRGKHAK